MPIFILIARQSRKKQTEDSRMAGHNTNYVQQVIKEGLLLRKKSGHKGIAHVIFVLMVLLAISGTMLAGTILYKYAVGSRSASVIVPDNVITSDRELSISGRNVQTVQASMKTIVDEAESDGTVLRLYRNRAEDTVPFQVRNMFPGDKETKSYHLEVSYKGSLTLHFHADIWNGYEKLAEVLKCRVTLQDNGAQGAAVQSGNTQSGMVLYDGLMGDMPEAVLYQLPQSSGKTENLTYQITVYLDTSVGNEYMEKELMADFRWWVNVENESDETEGSGGSGNGGSSGGGGTDRPTVSPTMPSEIVEPIEPEPIPDSGTLIAPKTGDTSDAGFWMMVGGAAVLLMTLLVLLRKREKEVGSHEQ